MPLRTQFFFFFFFKKRKISYSASILCPPWRGPLFHYAVRALPGNSKDEYFYQGCSGRGGVRRACSMRWNRHLGGAAAAGVLPADTNALNDAG